MLRCTINLNKKSRSLCQKLMWFVGFYIVSIILIGGFVFLMRLIFGLPT
jgi:K+-transporting ATPase A subunit